MRKISKTLALMSFIAPLGANALGIGEIRLHSALNQTLIAEIPLETSSSEELSGIRVTLASPEAFSRAGIERNYVLSRLRFTPQQKSDGSYVIRVSSRDAIREPFLNFMIDVYWPQGRMQREFTVLLDPPASFRENSYANEELPEVESVPRAYEPPPFRPRPSVPAQEKPRRTIRENKPTPIRPVTRAETPISGTPYGPVYRNETLWSIAKRFNKDPSISQAQMMVALYKANPNAFYKNNMDALKAGETLTIPDRTTIAALSGAASMPQSSRSSGRLTSKPQSQPESAKASSGEPNTWGQLKLLSPTESKPKGELASSGEKAKAGKSREDIALEVADTVKQESEEIRTRLAELEQKLSGMQRLLSLKDEQIASLQAVQQKQPTIQSPQPEPAQAPAQPPNPEAQAVVSPTAPGVQPAITQPPPAAPLDQEVQTQAQPTPITKPPETIPPPPVSRPASKPLAHAKPSPSPQPSIKAPPQEEEGFFEGLLERPFTILAGGASGLLLLAGGAWLLTRRRKEMVKETESILNLNGNERVGKAIKSSGIFDATLSSISDHTSSATRSSFLSEFTPSDFEALGGEMEDVDPVSEADVYLAYGRYKQAEELIRGAIAQNPERDDCKLKLLEIHYSTENAQAFEKFAEELAPTHQHIQPDFWEKVVEMGQELCPDSPLFREHKKSPLHAVRKEPSSASTEKKTGEDQYFIHNEVDESFGYPLSHIAESRQQGSVDDTHTILSHDFFSTATKGTESGRKSDDESELHKLDNIISFDTHQAKPIDKTSPVRDKTLDEILAELGVQSTSEPLAPKQAKAEQDKELGLDFELGFDPMLSMAGNGAKYNEEPSDYLALTETDEQETKLDLAKAYFDMGDEKEARVILENVVKQGTEKQKEEAWSLLDRLTKQETSKRQ